MATNVREWTPPPSVLSERRLRRWLIDVDRRKRDGWTFETYTVGDRIYWNAAIPEISLLKRVRPVVESIDWSYVREGKYGERQPQQRHFDFTNNGKG